MTTLTSIKKNYFFRIISFALIYYGLALFCVQAAPQYKHVTAVWFSYSFGLTVLVVFGIRYFPSIFIGGLLFTQTMHVPWHASLISGIGDVISVIIGAWILTRRCHFNQRLATFKDAIALIVFGAFLPTAISAAIGSYSLYLSGVATDKQVHEAFKVWWFSDIAGTLTLSPLLLSLFSFQELARPKRPYERFEFLMLYFLFSITCWLLFANHFKDVIGHMLPSYAILVFVVWGALRFSLKVVTSIVMLASFAAILGNYYFPLSSDTAIQGIYVLELQFFMSSMSAIGLLLSAAIKQQQEITHSLQVSMNQYAESEERLKVALDAAHMGTWTWEVSSGKIKWSENVEGIFRTKDFIQDGSTAAFMKVIYPPDRKIFEAAIQRAITGNDSVYSVDYRIVWPDGTHRWIEGKGYIFKDKAGKPVRMAGVVADITDKKEVTVLRENLLKQEKESRIGAEVSVKQRDEFLSIASHELRTPLTAVLMSIQLVKRQFQNISLEIPEKDLLIKNIQKAENNLNRFVKLVSNLLDVSSITADRLVLNPEHFDLSALVNEIIDRYKPELKESGCELSATIEPGVEGQWDIVRIEQVITNLLNNSMKYGAGNPIEISLHQFHNVARLSVKDYGIGISKEDTHKLFARFERIAPVRNFGGLGLGLYISKNIITAHGGVISVDSDIGKGATFTIDLPIKS